MISIKNSIEELKAFIGQKINPSAICDQIDIGNSELMRYYMKGINQE